LIWDVVKAHTSWPLFNVLLRIPRRDFGVGGYIVCGIVIITYVPSSTPLNLDVVYKTAKLCWHILILA